MPFVTRFFYAFAWFLRIWFDGRFAAGVAQLARHGATQQLEPGPSAPARLQQPEEPEPEEPEAAQPMDREATEPGPEEATKPAPGGPVASTPQRLPDATEALLLLGMLQREGRFIDFVQQDVTEFSDEQVGATARIVHQGCRRVLAEHLTLEPVRAEAEGSRVTLEAGFEAAAVKLTGNVQGEPPFHGVVQHRGWRALRLKLPQAVGQGDPQVLAPAEVEL